MILVDTSIWVDHLRHSEGRLADLLNQNLVLIHPFVIGELALGNLKNREELLSALLDLPQSLMASNSEVLRLIEQRDLYGMGIGFIDAHLLAATVLTPGTLLWSRDKRLCAVASTLGLAANADH